MKIHDFNTLENEEVNSSYLRKAVYGKSLSLARVEVKQGETTQTHSHDTEEMVYVLSGEWLFRFPDGDVVVKENQMIEIPTGVEHSSMVLEDVVALDICAKRRPDWISGQDKVLHTNPEQTLWGV